MRTPKERKEFVESLSKLNLKSQKMGSAKASLTPDDLIRKIYAEIFHIRNVWMEGKHTQAKIECINGRMHWIRCVDSSFFDEVSETDSNYNYLRSFYAYLIAALNIYKIFGQENKDFVQKIFSIREKVRAAFRKLLGSSDESTITMINSVLEAHKVELLSLLSTLNVESDIKVLNKMLDSAKDWAALEEDSYIISTLIDFRSGDIHRKIVILDEPLTELLQEQKDLFDDLENQPWFQSFEKEPFTQALIKLYQERILSGRSIIPSQLRKVLALNKNFYKQSLWVENSFGEMEMLIEDAHCGTPAYYRCADEEQNIELSRDILRQQKFLLKTDVSLFIGLNSSSADLVLQPLAYLSGNEYSPEDSAITRILPKAAEQLDSEGIYYSKICLNGFKWLESADYQGINTIIALISENINKVRAKLDEDTIKEMETFINQIQYWESTYYEYQGKGINIIYLLTRLAFANRQLCEKFDSDDLKTVGISFGCASGENRTGITYFDILCQALSDYFRKNELVIDEDELVEDFALSGHFNILTGNQGSTFGTEGIRGKSAGSLHSRLRHIQSALIKNVADQKNIILKEEALNTVGIAPLNKGTDSDLSSYDPSYCYELDDFLEIIQYSVKSLPDDYDIDLYTLQHENFQEAIQLKFIEENPNFFLRQQLRYFLENKNIPFSEQKKGRRIVVPIAVSSHWISLCIQQEKNLGKFNLTWSNNWERLNEAYQKEFPNFWESVEQGDFDKEEALDIIFETLIEQGDCKQYLTALYTNKVYIYETTGVRLEAQDSGNPAKAMWPALNNAFQLSKDNDIDIREINRLTNHQLVVEQKLNSQDCGPFQAEVMVAFILNGHSKVSSIKTKIEKIRHKHYQTSAAFQYRQQAVTRSLDYLDIERENFLEIHVRTREEYLVFKYLLKELSICQNNSDVPLSDIYALLNQNEEAFRIIQSSSLMYGENKYSIHSRGISELHDWYADETQKIGPKIAGVQPGFVGICIKDLLFTLYSHYPDRWDRIERMMPFLEKQKNVFTSLYPSIRAQMPNYLIKNAFEIDSQNNVCFSKEDVNRTSVMKKIYANFGEFIGSIAAAIYVEVKKGYFADENIKSAIEVLANDIAEAFGMPVQEQTILPRRYKNNLLNWMLKGKLINAPILGPLQDGYLARKVGENLFLSDSSIQLAEYLLLFLWYRDFDGIGSRAQNKLCLNKKIFGIDFGHVFERELNVKEIHGDFSFDYLGLGFSNYSVFYDCPRSEIVKGLIRLARLAGEIHEGQDKVLLSYGEAFYSAIYALDEHADEQIFKDYINKLEFIRQGETIQENIDFCSKAIETLEALEPVVVKGKVALVHKFYSYLEMEAQTVDLVENLEKIWAGKDGSSLYSPNGTVLLNHLRLLKPVAVVWTVNKLGKEESIMIAQFPSEKEAQNAFMASRAFFEKYIQYDNKAMSISFSSHHVAEISESIHEAAIKEAYHPEAFKVYCEVKKSNPHIFDGTDSNDSADPETPRKFLDLHTPRSLTPLATGEDGNGVDFGTFPRDEEESSSEPISSLQDKIELILIRDELKAHIERLKKQKTGPHLFLRSPEHKIRIASRILQGITQPKEKIKAKTLAAFIENILNEKTMLKGKYVSNWDIINSPRNVLHPKDTPSSPVAKTTMAKYLTKLYQSYSDLPIQIDLSEETLEEKREQVVCTFLELYLDKWRKQKKEFGGFFRRKGLKDYENISLESILMHAHKGNRSFKILVEKGWIDKKGGISGELIDLLPDELQQITNLTGLKDAMNASSPLGSL